MYAHYNEAVALDSEIDVINAPHTCAKAQKDDGKKENASRNHFDAETTELAQIQSHGINAIRMMKRFNFKLDTEMKSKLEREKETKWKPKTPFK